MPNKKYLKQGVNCLDLALHPDTGDCEAIAAIHGYRRKVKAANDGRWMTMESVGTELYSDRYDGRDLPEYEEEWREKLETQEEEIIKLRIQVARLKEQNEKMQAERDAAVEKLAQVKQPPEWVSGAQPEMFQRGVNGKEKTKTSIPWSDDDREFLASLYERDPNLKNRDMAQRCTGHFGRVITENAIRGMLNTLRYEGRLARYRPGHERKRGNQRPAA